MISVCTVVRKRNGRHAIEERKRERDREERERREREREKERERERERERKEKRMSWSLLQHAVPRRREKRT
jgi:hypothetical protein